ncbi:MAG: hypothetical protein RL501_464, partial [Bacteroidota bacterium]
MTHSDPTILLSVHQLSKRYGKRQAVHPLSFDIKKGFVYGLLGPNGSGKSTTLGMVLQVVNPTSGSFTWFQGQCTPNQALKKIGAIIERPNFYPYLSAYKNLEIVCLIKGVPLSAIEDKLELVGLLGRKHDSFDQYSLGMKQRLAIASALLNDPEVLILDEPTNGLDPEGIHQIRGIIKKVAALGTTIVLASHLLDEVEKVCDRVLVLQEGHMIFEGSVLELLQEQQTVYLESPQNQALTSWIKTNPAVLHYIPEGMGYLIQFNEELPTELINKQLAENGIYLSVLQKHKTSLEDRFLAMTHKN